MRRDAGIRDPRVVAGVPVERTAGMTMDEFRHMEYVTATLHHCRARVDRQSQILYETSESLVRVANYATMAVVAANRERRMVRKLCWAIGVLGVIVLVLLGRTII